MADMQRLMEIVRRLEEQGVDVVNLLEGNAPMPMQPFTGPGAITDGMPMPEFKPFTGPGPGAIDDGMPMQSFTGPGAIIDGRSMPEFQPFTGPGPGAYITDRDNEIILRRMMRDRTNRQAPMSGLLQMIGGQ